MASCGLDGGLWSVFWSVVAICITVVIVYASRRQ